MSEFTSAVLVKDRKKKDIEDCMKLKDITGQVVTVNKKWRMIAGEGDPDKNAQALSEGLSTYVFNFVNFEDHGWGYILYNNGTEEASLIINYIPDIPLVEDGIDRTDNANIELLRRIGGDVEALAGLENYLKMYKQSPEMLFMGVECFKMAFDFEQVSWTGIDEAYVQPVDIGPRPKAINLKKIVLEEMKKGMNEMGYEFDQKFSGNGLYSFYKLHNGFRVGLEINKERCGNIIRTFLHASAIPKTIRYHELFYITEGKKRELEYSSAEEVRQYLKEVLVEFKTKGDAWVMENSMESFDPYPVYMEIADPFMEKYSFKRIVTDKDLLTGGNVIYSKGDIKIRFNHGQVFVAKLSCYITERNVESIILEYIEGHGYIQHNIVFKNKNEYREALLELLKMLEDNYSNIILQ